LDLDFNLQQFLRRVFLLQLFTPPPLAKQENYHHQKCKFMFASQRFIISLSLNFPQQPASQAAHFDYIYESGFLATVYGY